jgi:hypothetical protein
MGVHTSTEHCPDVDTSARRYKADCKRNSFHCTVRTNLVFGIGNALTISKGYHMSAIQSDQDLLASQIGTRRPLSSAAALVQVGIMLAGTESNAATSELCIRCRAEVDLARYAARLPNVFCSERCEQEFVRSSLASLTLGDCILIQRRLETLMMTGTTMRFHCDKFDS